jgi:hypothetical protein
VLNERAWLRFSEVLGAFAWSWVPSDEQSDKCVLGDPSCDSDAGPNRRGKEDHPGGADSKAPRITPKRSDSLFRIPTNGSLMDRVCTGKERR